MRPMPIIASDNVTGAWYPKKFEGLVMDDKLRITPKITFMKNGEPGYGAYIEIAKTKFDVHRFWNTMPQPTLTLRPQMPQVSKQVNNPTPLIKMPGYTNQVDYSTTQISQMVTKPYLGSPVM